MELIGHGFMTDFGMTKATKECSKTLLDTIGKYRKKSKWTDMLRGYILTSLFLLILLTSCDNSLTNTVNRHSSEKHTAEIPTKEVVDDNFNDFIVKFSSDSTFQLSRTKFPLKVKWYDIDKDSLIYKDRSDFEMMDFRKKKSSSHYDQWEQKIVLDKNNISATIEIRGIDNGIMVDYLFEKINDAWMLFEIDDMST